MEASSCELAFIFSGGELLISKDWRVNEEIRAKEVRLISETGEQLGIVSLKEALDVSLEKGLDLVEIAPLAKPPVCRLMDYGKFKFEQSKREKEARKKQKIIEVKEIKMRPNIEEHDLMVKAKNARKFLNSGDKVKVTIMFRGRQITHPELGEKLCLRFAEVLSDVSNIEKKPKIEGKNMVMVLMPKPENEKNANKKEEA
ncbi:translation initiation factor IF-3 [Thermosyntropha sp.]|uniref:translation initiation factor IF-3 n=1 Tax=Thermosyntropha sp. TaxID=2740820 RepID=UPI0025DCFC59|nr:translation initiation factor IF-3 [Thermosyntropha sp.]MBO8158612.1 translation initiation factor IF-3 [Thermosyntropha sp.]